MIELRRISSKHSMNLDDDHDIYSSRAILIEPNVEKRYKRSQNIIIVVSGLTIFLSVGIIIGVISLSGGNNSIEQRNNVETLKTTRTNPATKNTTFASSTSPATTITSILQPGNFSNAIGYQMKITLLKPS